MDWVVNRSIVTGKMNEPGEGVEPCPDSGFLLCHRRRYPIVLKQSIVTVSSENRHAGKKSAHILIPVGFPGQIWGKSGGGKSLDLKAFDSHRARGFPAAFLLTGRIITPASIGTEKSGFAGFSGRMKVIGTGKGARNGLKKDHLPEHVYRPGNLLCTT